jgi:hypothetical protein
MARSLAHAWIGGSSLLLVAPSPCAAGPTIRHQAPACVLAEAFPRVTASITPSDSVVRARVLFASDLATGAASAWYAVPMVRQGESFAAVLPRPRVSARSLRYVIEAYDASATVFRDEEHVALVVADPDACRDGGVAESVSFAEVVVDVPPGAPLAPPVPPGFSPIGASAAATAPARKGGHKGLVLALAAAGVAGTGAALLAGHQDKSVPQPQAGISFENSDPPPGSTVSVSRTAFALALGIVLPESPPLVTVRARLYSSASPTRACGTMRDTFPAPGFASYDVILRGFETASPCGPVDRVQIWLEDDQGQVVLATGSAGRPDFALSYVFEP